MSLPSSRSVAAHGRFTAASPKAKRSRPAPRGYSRPEHAECSQMHPTSHHQFHARARSIDPHFHARAAPEPHIFHFAVAHTYQNVGRVPPPPRSYTLNQDCFHISCPKRGSDTQKNIVDMNSDILN